jgi:4'-phosphopantetheinyl transferase
MLAGELLAMYAIAQVYHIPMAEQRLGQSQEGKPFLINRQDVHFSISHSKNTVAVAVCDTKVGIDIEHITEYRPALARRICTDRERCRIEESENPVAMLVEYWTRKEAAVKMTGDGLKGIFAETSVEYDCTTMQREDFFVTVAWETDGCGKLVF